ncbi:cytochrome P450 [Saccharomonospora sp. NPDC046836]|uniref:cytochrome P450 n=1 Tax=Saccharomonospora sp. NPDC046836 TaxID=3156921 RepID=UPI0033F5D026
MRRLHARYGPGPLLLRAPGRPIAVLLDPDDVGRILCRTPAPFHPAGIETRSALRRFQPHAVLATHGSERRHYNEMALESTHEQHSVTGPAKVVVREEAEHLLAGRSTLDWNAFAAAWWRIVRRIVFGDAARDESGVTERLSRLRPRAWPTAARERQAFQRELAELLDRAESGSLAKKIADTPAGPGVDPYEQVTQWLFAFDTAGAVTLRALALLATHPRQAALAREEVDTMARPYLRSCVLEAVRLWPTTPMLVRESITATSWRGVQLPVGTTFVAFAPYFHRDPGQVPFADTFAPETWLDGRARRFPALVPFSTGPGQCPGKNLVLYVTSTLLAELCRHGVYRLAAPRRLSPRLLAPRLLTPNTLSPLRPLPTTLDHFGLRFAYEARSSSS